MAKAKNYADCFLIVEQKVKPERMVLRDTADGLRLKERWWLYGRSRPELYEAIKGKERVFVAVLHTKYWSVTCYSPTIVFSHALAVFSEADFGTFSVLESFVHESWARAYSSSLETRMRYTPSDCFETFPFPDKLSDLAFVGAKYDDYRRQTMLARQEGLTKIYNRFHDSDEVSGDIQTPRQLHVEMDAAVAAAYGWTDLDLGHGFHETKLGVRYTIGESARCEVLARLLKLNHERYAEEVKQGLHEKKAKGSATSRPKAKAAKQKVAAEPSLFDSHASFPNTERDNYLCGLVCDLVGADPGLPATAYLDSIVIALGYERHKRLLTGNDRTAFAKLCKAIPAEAGPSDRLIPWGDLKSVLSLRKAISLEGQAIQAGSELDVVRRSYPAASAELVGLLRKAAAELRDLQAQAAPLQAEKAEILHDVEMDRQQRVAA